MIRTICTNYGPTEHNLAVRDDVVAKLGFLVVHCPKTYEVGDILRWRRMLGSTERSPFMATRIVGFASPEDLAAQKSIIGRRCNDAPEWEDRDDWRH